MKRYPVLLLACLVVLFLNTIAFGQVVDTSKLVFVVMKPQPALGTQLITFTFLQDGKIIAIRQYQSGKLQKSEGEIPDGPVLELYGNGDLNAVFNFSGGFINGKVFSYYKNGVLKKEGMYLKGNPDGEIRWYSENGILSQIEYFDAGKLVKVEKFSENGLLVETEQY